MLNRPAHLLLFSELFFGAALSAVVTCLFLRSAPLRRPRVITACALGVLSPGINYVLAVSGLAMTNASVTSIASGTEPIAIVLLQRCWCASVLIEFFGCH